MNTEDLIRALNADRPTTLPSLSSTWRLSCALAISIAATAFFVMLGPRPDIAQAAETVRFLFKFVVTVALALSALIVLTRLSRPGARLRQAALWLIIAPVLLAISVALELLAVPSGQWTTQLIGSNSAVCLTFIPLIGISPLALFINVLRYGAPTRPGLAGAMAGLAAGGIAATFYAAQCTDDSPLFVATWYPIAVMMLTALGYVSGRYFARW